MNKILDALKGKKTIILVVLGLVANALVGMGYIDASVIDRVNSVLVILIGGTIRLGMLNK